MTPTPKVAISVIVPIYNAEHTLPRCVDSIVAQSFTDWELVLVDDGSGDHSGEICDRYASQDERIRVIHKPNEGVAATRMAGITAAVGEYSIQVDADDWVEPQMLERLYATARSEDADVVICDFYDDYDGRKPQRYRAQKPLGLESGELLRDLLEGHQLRPYCWNKLVRQECYSKYGVVIPGDISHGEDFLLCLALFKNPDIKVAYHHEAYYHYVQAAGCNLLTRTYSKEDYERDVRLGRYCAELMSDHPLRLLVEQRNAYHIVRRAFNGGIFTSEEFKDRTYGFRNLIRGNRHIAWHRRWRLYLACVGHYRLMHGYRKLLGK